MSAISEYLKHRKAKPLAIADGITEAMDKLAEAGAAVDSALVRAERTKAVTPRADVGRLERTVQTLAGMSREIWAAHGAALVAAQAVQQLAEAEAELAESEKAAR